MKLEILKELVGEKFRRLTGIERSTFEKMIVLLSEAEKRKRDKSGRKNKLSLKDPLLMSLERIREYCNSFQVSQSYGISEV